MTQVLGCCTFAWSESNGRRVVIIPEGAHVECLAELDRAARAQGVLLTYLPRAPARDGGARRKARAGLAGRARRRT